MSMHALTDVVNEFRELKWPTGMVVDGRDRIKNVK
jgi:hypothetical protein